MNKFKVILFIILIFILQENLLAVTEQATFEVFYVEDSYIGWIIAGIAALIAGAVIFFTGGTASPIVVGVGTWIGEMAGLSGAAATNYGLALLGGGSIASGGLGMAGGVAVITVALSFSTDVVIDYSLGNIISKYSYNKFVEDSKKMPTLPIPQNESGSDEYENTIEYLKENINNKETLFSNHNQMILSKALQKYNLSTNNIKDNVLKSYLYFVTNQYYKAKKYSINSIEMARDKKIRRTFPAFIYATSSLYDSKFDFDLITQNYFRYSILAEPDNKLIPLMFAIYLDRILYRMNDDSKLNYKTLNKIRDISFEIKDKDIKLQSMVVIMMRYFIRIKIEQQKILALTTTQNNAIKNNNKTLKIVKQSFEEYKSLLVNMKNIINNNDIQEYILDNDKLKNLNILYAKYEESEKYLKLRIDTLKKYQDNIKLIDNKKTNKPFWKFW